MKRIVFETSSGSVKSLSDWNTCKKSSDDWHLGSVNVVGFESLVDLHGIAIHLAKIRRLHEKAGV